MVKKKTFLIIFNKMWVGMRRLSPCLHMHACPLFFSRLLARRRKMAPRTIVVVKGGV